MERGCPQRQANPDQEGSHRNLPAGPCGSRRRTRAARRLRCCCEIPVLRRHSSPEPARVVERCEGICVAATAPEVLSDPGDAPSKSTETGVWDGARRGWRQVGWASYCSSSRSRCFFSIRSQRGALRLTKRRS